MTDITRRVHLTQSEITHLASLAAADNSKEGAGLCQKLRGVLDECLDPEYQRLTAAYRAAAETYNGKTEIDGDAEVSMSDEGAYVMVWQWVSLDAISDEDGGSNDSEDACRTCGEEYEEGGDGYDGECPDCADKTCANEGWE